MLQHYADEVVFCDINSSLKAEWNEIAHHVPQGMPKATFLVEDAASAVARIQTIDVLFYRRDSTGEGGSAIFVLGDSFLPKMLARLPEEGGYIISDGSNSRGNNFERMIRPSGLSKHGFRFEHAALQPFLEHQKLHVIRVLRKPTAV